jgi:hypothetical protein
VPDSVVIGRPVELSAQLAPAVPVRPSALAETLATRPPGPARPYGVGPRQSRWFPGFSASAEGVGAEAVVTNADPVGRLSLRLGGALGEPGVWRGVAGGATWRRRASLSAEAYWAEQTPSRRLVGPAAEELDLRLRGGDVRLALVRDDWAIRHRLHAGVSVASIDPVAATAIGVRRTRALGFLELHGSYRQRRGDLRLSQAFTAHGDGGRIGDDRFVRGLVAGTFGARGPLPFGGVVGSIAYGELRGTSDPFEQFAIGGAPVPLVDESVIAQRIAMPALPTGTARGERVVAFRLELPSGPLWPYYWGASTANRASSFTEWHRVFGAELRLGSDGLPIIALPEVQLVLGYGRSLDPPYRRGNRAYAALTYRR